MSSFLELQRENLEEKTRQSFARTSGWSASSLKPDNSDATVEIATVSSQPRIGRIVNGTPTSEYEAVGKVGATTYGYGCSGTLIGSRYVLTAGHCAVGVGDTQGKFQVNGQNYQTSRVFVHPDYNDNTLANDIAIYELNRDVQGVAPAEIFRGTPRVGQELTLVGFGAGGTGNGGHTGDYGTKRVGTTDIDRVTAKEIIWEFDNNTESNTAPGDSGGAAFLTVSGKLYLAGVTSGGDQTDAGIGDTSYDTRVDAFKSWIDSIVKSTDGGGGGGGGGVGVPVDDHANTLNSKATLIRLINNTAVRTDGTIETESDLDVFRFTISKVGLVVISAKSTDGLDPKLRLYDASGNLIRSNDNITSATTDSRILLKLNAGTYYAAVEASGNDETGDYWVRAKLIEQNATGDDHGNSFATATAKKLNAKGGMHLTANIEKGSDVDVFKLTANKDGTLRLNANRLSGNLDTVLTVYNRNGRRLKRNDDYGFSLNSRVEINAKAGSSYYVMVSSYSTSKGQYRLTAVSSGASRAALNGFSRGDAFSEIDLSQTQVNRSRSNPARQIGRGELQSSQDSRQSLAGISLNLNNARVDRLEQMLSRSSDPMPNSQPFNFGRAPGKGAGYIANG